MTGTVGGGSGKPGIGKARNRRDFLKISGFGLAGAALLSGSVFAFSRYSRPEPAPRLGISPANTGTRNRDNLLAAIGDDPGAYIVFPPGDYLVDNSDFDIIFENFEGSLKMEPEARFVFTDGRRRGFNFNGGTSARFDGLKSTFRDMPTERIASPPQACVIFHDTTDTTVVGAEIDGSASGGLAFYRCIRPSVHGTRIANTMADGLHFANCEDARASSIVTDNTGDDGLAFVNYSDAPDYSGGHATDITVRNSKARGIAVAGQRDVTVEDFKIYYTAESGAYCAYDSSFDTRKPSNVRFINGEAHYAGQKRGYYEDSTNKCGILFDGVESVEFENIKVISPRLKGVGAGTIPHGTVRLKDIEVLDAPEGGFFLVNGEYHLDNLTINGSGKTGVYVGGNKSVNFGKLTSINTSKTDTLRRAFWFEHNAQIDGKELHVVDEQTTPTGFRLSTYGWQTGHLGVVYDGVSNGEVEIDNRSGLTIARTERAKTGVGEHL